MWRLRSTFVPKDADSFPFPDCPTTLSRRSDVKQHSPKQLQWQVQVSHLWENELNSKWFERTHYREARQCLPNTPSETILNLNHDASLPYPQPGAEARRVWTRVWRRLRGMREKLYTISKTTSTLRIQTRSSQMNEANKIVSCLLMTQRVPRAAKRQLS